MEKGILIIPSAGDTVRNIQKIIDPTVSDSAYPISTMWINTLTNSIFIHTGSGVWTQTGGPGAGGEWGTGELVTIVGGVITVTAGKWYKVETEGLVASDDLDTINGLSAGEEVMLSANNDARTVVLKNGVDNLNIRGDISMNDIIDRIRLISDGTNLVEASSRP